MKITAITGAKGELVAIVDAHFTGHDRNVPNGDAPRAMLREAPGQKFHELIAPDEYERSPADLRLWVLAQIPRPGMKITAIIGAKAELVAIVDGHLTEHDRRTLSEDGPHATLRPMPGQTFHELLAPTECEGLPSAELRRWVLSQVARRAA